MASTASYFTISVGSNALSLDGTGANLIITPLNITDTNQQWFVDSGYIVSVANNDLVLDVNNNETTAGTKVQVWHKKNGTNQKWVINGNPGTIESQLKAGLFLDISGASPVVDYNAISITETYLYTAVTQGQTYVPTAPLTAFTATAVINPSSAAGGRIWDRITAGGVDGWLLDLYPNVHLRIIIGNQAVGGPAVPINTNSYVAITYDGTTGVAYLNGASVISTVHALPANNFPVRVGFDSNNQNIFGGTINRAQIYPEALTAAQIQNDYAAARAQLGF